MRCGCSSRCGVSIRRADSSRPIRWPLAVTARQCTVSIRRADSSRPKHDLAELARILKAFQSAARILRVPNLRTRPANGCFTTGFNPPRGFFASQTPAARNRIGMRSASRYARPSPTSVISRPSLPVGTKYTIESCSLECPIATRERLPGFFPMLRRSNPARIKNLPGNRRLPSTNSSRIHECAAIEPFVFSRNHSWTASHSPYLTSIYIFMRRAHTMTVTGSFGRALPTVTTFCWQPAHSG